ncbi:hypothetical protein N5C16_02970 [Stenotrophomonas sp. GD03908]|uniref:Uncharacterized protein n=1 Tax=Stenotrophomonas maltophilia TaxID=40324 RepID=A0AAJ2THS7_STEMA|nr:MULTISPECIES: hypothetical protein [Stenotrophomonas]MDH0978226.1 hypothetical protein [Stenotrophomonas sp. GD03908]MDQ7292945.1 hypothetical protein [Stenotrophomonas sp. Sm0041]MDZ5763504.1 hypothetical protein [Stenotrophomonas maltophilia]
MVDDRVAIAISIRATADRILPAMDSRLEIADSMSVPRHSGWVQSGERWDLWWNGRSVANIVPHAVLGFRVCLEARRVPKAKIVAAANARQAKRYAERWCAARLCPQLRLRDAVARVVGATLEAGRSSPVQSRQQRQQARRLAEAGAGEVARIKKVLALRKAVPAPIIAP